MQTTEYIQFIAKGPEAGLLKLSGELTVKNAQKIRENILKAIQTYKNVEILIDQPEAIDITLFQLLEAAHLSAHKRKKELSFTYSLSDDIRELCRKAGFTLENQ